MNSNYESAVSHQVLQRMLVRERLARKQAELRLEERNRQLYRSHSELQHFSEALEREAQRAKAIFDTAAEGIIIFDDTGKIQSLNEAAFQIFDLLPSEAGSMSVCDILPDAAFCKRGAGQCFASELKQVVNDRREIQGRKVDGTLFPVEFVTSSFSAGEVRCHSGIVRDLTRRKLLEAQLTQAQRLESVGQLAAGIAHELNTPIQFVGDNTRFLRESFLAIDDTFKQIEQILDSQKGDGLVSVLTEQIRAVFLNHDLSFVLEEVPEAIDQTLQGTENVARIVRAMKVFSHPGTNDFQEVDLNQSIESTITVSRNEWKYCAELKANLAADLPRLYCLPGELNQAFLNIIVNGAHAIQAKSLKELGELTITSRSEGAFVHIDFQDTGTGIPVAIRNRIFDPFFTTKGVGKGTGQGLSIAYNVIVEMHKGKLSFDSVEGVGTTFHIALPIDPRSTENRSVKAPTI